MRTILFVGACGALAACLVACGNSGGSGAPATDAATSGNDSATVADGASDSTVTDSTVTTASDATPADASTADASATDSGAADTVTADTAVPCPLSYDNSTLPGRTADGGLPPLP